MINIKLDKKAKTVISKTADIGGGSDTGAGACLLVKFPEEYSGNFSAHLLDGTELPISDLPNNYEWDSYSYKYTTKLVYGIPLDLENGVEVIIKYIPSIGINDININGFSIIENGAVIDRENNTVTLSNRAEIDGDIYPFAVRGWSELSISDYNPK